MSVCCILLNRNLAICHILPHSWAIVAHLWPCDDGMLVNLYFGDNIPLLLLLMGQGRLSNSGGIPWNVACHFNVRNIANLVHRG
jgi:hypothetical protein